jgi:hypothetical protein
MFYIYKLKEKDETDYNGIETFVSECIDADDLNWFPVDVALALKQQVQEKDSEDSGQKILKLKEQVQQLINKMNRIREAAEKKAKDQGKKKVKKKWKNLIGKVSLGKKMRMKGISLIGH